MWYLGMVALQDEETQKKGIVWIRMQFHSMPVFSPAQFRDMQEVERGIPYKVAGGHFCYFDPSVRPLAAGLLFNADASERNRTRIHSGSKDEIFFKLQTFGIPTQDIQLHEDGTFDATMHKEFLVMQRSQEDIIVQNPTNDDDESHIIVPGRFDVLFGRNQFAREHTGTRRALHIVQMEFESYERMGKFQKTDAAERIMSIIHESGGRFLRQNEEGAWVLAEDGDARNKIGHWFRGIRSKRVASQTDSLKSVTKDNRNCNIKKTGNGQVSKRVADSSPEDGCNHTQPQRTEG